MAELVLAMGTSHSPMLGSPPEHYPLHAERDKANPHLLDKDGRPRGYGDLLAAADPDLAEQLRPEVFARRADSCRKGLERLAQTLSETAPDAVIVVGDDQGEQFLDDNMPAMLIYCGETIANAPSPLGAEAPAYWRHARSQFHEQAGVRDYPVDAALGRHLIEYLVGHDFDFSYSTRLPRGIGEGHAFGFVHRRLMGARVFPIVPLVLNTYFPPNQPTPARCHDLGRMIARAIEAWDGAGRVAIIASGGLSHFTIDEELDRGVLEAMRTGDAETLRSVPTNRLNSGNSEIRNWITAAAAAEGLESRWQTYEPCYRSPAGTGCGMAFAVWS